MQRRYEYYTKQVYTNKSSHNKFSKSQVMNGIPGVRAAENIMWTNFETIVLPLAATFTSQEMQEKDHATSTEKKQQNQILLSITLQH